MANTRALRRRIKSVKSTAQITKAMQMVAATKMRRAQNQALNGRPYSFNLSSALAQLLPTINITSHPLLGENSSKTAGVALLTTDKSLCGALNTNLFRLISAASLPSVVKFYTVGKKGRSFVARAGKDLVADFDNLDIVTFRQAVQLSKLLVDSFLQAEVGQVLLIYPKFVSTIRQEPAKIKILPIEYSQVLEAAEEAAKPGREFLFEPDAKGLLDYILVHFVQIKIYQALLETKASEHSARMIAMQSATDNALELVDDLNLTYNQTRQNSITNELLEITTAAQAMQ